MRVVFLTPIAALVALAIALPVAEALLRERRDRRVRRALGLAAPGRLARFGSTAAAAGVLACLAAAAAQPAVRTTARVAARTDAQAFFVLDVTRSMGATASPHGPTRLARADAIAERLARALEPVPSGVASLTDRLLPHVYPTPDRRVFASVLHRSIGIGRPAPGAAALVNATDLGALEQLRFGYFGHVRRRLAIVLTDGESVSFRPGLLFGPLAVAHVGLLLLRVWGAHESIPGDSGYHPDLASTAALEALAPSLVGRRVFDERSVGAAAAAARRYFEHGPEATQGHRVRTVRLAKYAALGAALPLLLLLRRERP